jgi:hypothetical protein
MCAADRRRWQGPPHPFASEFFVPEELLAIGVMGGVSMALTRPLQPLGPGQSGPDEALNIESTPEFVNTVTKHMNPDYSWWRPVHEKRE